MIRRPVWVWLWFAVVVAVLTGVMAWMSAAMLSMEQREIDREAMETSVRRSLWRMDSYVGPIIATESARPYYIYESFFNSPEAYTKLYEPIDWGEVREPSPLLTEVSEFVRLHFQVHGDSRIESPQVPTGNMRDVAEVDYVSFERIESYDQRLKEIEPVLVQCDFDALLVDAPPVQWAVEVAPELEESLADSAFEGAPLPQQSRASPTMDAQSRDQMLNRTNAQMSNVMRQQAAKSRAGQALDAGAAPAHVHEGAMTPLWVDGRLLLVRKVSVDGNSVFQGCWLDWEVLEGRLTEEVSDLLPEARLVPATDRVAEDDPFMLRSIPAVLKPGAIPAVAAGSLTQVELSLLLAWIGMVVAALAAATLLHGVLRLSERRASFVSVVTHELRTPLTTFRLYTDLLRDRGNEPDKRERYVDTLSSESGRLAQLVENVLAYSRIERGKTAVEPAPVQLGTMLDRLRPCLDERAVRAGMEIEWSEDPGHLGRVVIAQEAVVGQVLTNLVDNACKYAHNAEHPAVQVTTQVSGRRLGIRVRDFGPGIAARERGLLFEPFRKLARDAAGTKPGIGLGLALSRRLARELGGDLVVESCDDGSGACFVLWLRAPSS